MGKGDLFDRGGGLIWWGRGAYLVGKGFFLVGNGGPIRLGRGNTWQERSMQPLPMSMSSITSS